MHQAEAIEPLPGRQALPALQLAGRDIYVREGCYNCHSQMVRTLRFETERYGHYSLAGESVYDRPHQWGSKRTGPTWRASAAATPTTGTGCTWTTRATWCRCRTCPAYPWLAQAPVDIDATIAGMKALRTLGDPLHPGADRRRRLRARRQDRAGRAGRLPAGPGQARTEGLTQ
jgi:cytochrome c oxidase cbb3-type subunit 2